ncbi:hypothetical protein CLV76_11722 [Marivita geojedonensis]|nr:hypothetical protein CLV76_11722 [Marivita geojedonensis]
MPKSVAQVLGPVKAALSGGGPDRRPLWMAGVRAGRSTARCVSALSTHPPDTSRPSDPRPVPSFGGTPQATTLSLRTLYVRSDHERRVSTGPSGYRFGASQALHGGEDVHPTQVTSPLFGNGAMPRHMNGKHGSSDPARPKDGPRPTLPPGGRIGVSFAQNHCHACDAASHCSEAACAHPGSGAYGFLNEHCTRRGIAPKVPAPSPDRPPGWRWATVCATLIFRSDLATIKRAVRR